MKREIIKLSDDELGEILHCNAKITWILSKDLKAGDELIIRNEHYS